MQSKIFSANKTLNLGGKLMDLVEPKVMAILNVTPDSFYDGLRYTEETTILKQVEKLLNQGADIIDIGGYSTRPGAEEISIEEEKKRVLPVIEVIKKDFPQSILSIDTFRSAVAANAVQAGASMVNDVFAGELDHEMFDTIASLNVPYVLMHSRGNPKTMSEMTDYGNMIREITDSLHQKIFKLHQLGVKDIIIDPGFGFAKTIAQNFELLNHLQHFQILSKPVLVGLSRKSMIWKTLKTNPENALNGTTALHTIALLKGASILRVHDVAEAKEVIQLVHQLNLK